MANNCEDIVKLHGRRHIVSPRARVVVVVDDDDVDVLLSFPPHGGRFCPC